MHRETLSRSLLYSHSLFGKTVGSFSRSSRNFSNSNSGRVVDFGRHLQPLSPTRHYHRSSWENTAQPAVEAKSTASASATVDGGRRNIEPPAPQIKKFNLKAKDILQDSNDGDEKKINYKTSEEYNEYVEVSDISSGMVMLDAKIGHSRNTEDLLSLCTEQQLTLKHACLIISRLGNIAVAQGRSDPFFIEKIRSDTRFRQIFNLVQRGNHSQFPHTLLQALGGLQKLGMENSSEVTKLVERELSWSMRRCPLKFLSRSVKIINQSINSGVVPVSQTDTDEDSILQSAIKVLHRRWIEAISGSDFISLFQIIELFDDERKTKIEERAADVAHQFTPLEIVKLFTILGAKKRRPTPLLRSLAFHYTRSNYKSPVKEAIEVVYSLNELTFAEPILMNKLCQDISEEIAYIKNPALISSLMTSLGQMKYKQREILLAVDDWIMKRLQILRPFDFAAWLQAVVTLNHSSPSLPSFCEAAQQVLTKSSVSSPTEWVNIVHSFTILNRLKPEMLSSVLNSTHVEIIENLGLKSTKQKIKLLNLNFLASKLKDYDGSKLSSQTVKDWTKKSVRSTDEKLSKVALESLANFLPPQKYLETNLQLESGVFIDALCFIDSKMMPTTLEKAKSAIENSVQKVAFVVEGYSGLCLGIKDQTGHSSFNLKLLEAEGYQIISVPYTEFGLNDKLVRRVQYLEQKLKTITPRNESMSPGK